MISFELNERSTRLRKIGTCCPSRGDTYGVSVWQECGISMHDYTQSALIMFVKPSKIPFPAKGQDKMNVLVGRSRLRSVRGTRGYLCANDVVLHYPRSNVAFSHSRSLRLTSGDRDRFVLCRFRQCVPVI